MQRQYQTRQRRAILAFLQEHPADCFSVKALKRALDAHGVSLGETTVYRTLLLLCEEGLVQKYTATKGEGASYQYAPKDAACEHHFHLKCRFCGKLLHTDCAQLHNLTRHIGEEHGFFVDHAKTVFYGACSACRRRRANT